LTDEHKAIEPSSIEITPREEMALHPLVLAAMQGRVDTDSLRAVIDMQTEHEAREAKRSFTRAIVELKRDLPPVINRDKVVDFTSEKGRTHYTHTSLAGAMRAVEDHLIDHGFSVSWVPSSNGREVAVTCKLTHRDGYHEEATLTSPPDTSGRKGPSQAIASTITLLQRYTLLALLGIATDDMSEPHGPRQASNPDVIDQQRNLRVAAAMRKKGLKPTDAEMVVNKPVSEWTASDIERIGEWVRRETANKPEREPGSDDEFALEGE